MSDGASANEGVKPVATATKPGEPKKCGTCGVVKPYTSAYYPVNYGKPVGAVCRDCDKKRKVLYKQAQRQRRADFQAKSLAVLAKDPAALARAAGKSPQALARVSRALQGQLEAATALSEGAAAVNKHAKQLLETIIDYAKDKSSIHHEWALKLLTERIIPRRLYEELGAQAAGIKAGEGAPKPSVTIIVQPSAGPVATPAVRVIDAAKVDEVDIFS